MTEHTAETTTTDDAATGTAPTQAQAPAHSVQGVTFDELVERFGSPLYVYDADVIARQFHGLRDRLHPAVEMFFSLKANPNVSICALLHSLGARAEVSSLAELLTAQRAGVPNTQIMFLGPGKSRGEIESCVKEDVTLICESFGELALIDATAAGLGRVARVVLRVNPSFAVKGGGLTMGGKPRQFGIDQEALEREGAALAARHGSVRLVGFQAYMGTRFLAEEVIAANTAQILELAEQLSARLGVEPEIVDVGGGLGVAYFSGERDLDAAALAEQLNPLFAGFHERHPATRLVMELGRYLLGHSGVYAVRVRYVKESMGERFAVADGGTNHHMAAVGIGSFVKRNFPMRLLNRPGAQPAVKWNVAGPLCTPNDTLGKAVELPADLRPGDVVGVERSGAYGPSASPVYFLSHGYPAEVLVHDGRALLIRTRDEVDAMLAPQILHEFGH